MLGLLLSFSAGPRLPSSSTGPADPPIVLCYYNPDAGVRNARLLASSLDGYFHGRGLEVEFQAYVNYDDLARAVAKRRADLILLPAWCSLPEKGCEGFEPELIPDTNGTAYHIKQLVVSRKYLSGAKRGGELAGDILAGKKIASTLDTSRTSDLVRGAIEDRLRVPAGRVEFIRVPKDFDALMAVATSRAAAAIVLPSSLELLQRRNAVASRRVAPIERTCRVLNPILYASSIARAPDTVRAVLDALTKMAEDDKGRHALSVMGYDGWRLFDPEVYKAIVSGSSSSERGGER